MTISSSDRVKFLFEDDVAFSMIITEVQASDAGKYTVTAVNKLGESKTSAILTIKGRNYLSTQNFRYVAMAKHSWHPQNG